MKTSQILTTICLGTWLVIGAMGLVRGQGSRTDINPALLYYRAFLLAPDMPEADQDYLATNFWRNQTLPERAGEMVARYDAEFKLVNQAARSTVPCDWGMDLTAGPSALMPQLARAKAVAIGAQYRVEWALQQGRQAEARDDLLGAFVLSRNISRDGTVISALVQIAAESILAWTIADNFGRFSPETLEQLVAGIDRAPAQGTIAEAVAVEKAAFHDSRVKQLQELRQQYSTDDARVMAALHELFVGNVDKNEEPELWKSIVQASGGSSAGVLKLLEDEEPYFPRLTELVALPLPEFLAREKPLQDELANSSNPLTKVLATLVKARYREARVQVTLAFVRAAVAYRLHGEEGLQSVTDPAGHAPFGFQRFLFQGADRGFQLKSVYEGSGFVETLVFVEKPGPDFLIGGPNVGKGRVN